MVNVNEELGVEMECGWRKHSHYIRWFYIYRAFFCGIDPWRTRRRFRNFVSITFITALYCQSQNIFKNWIYISDFIISGLWYGMVMVLSRQHPVAATQLASLKLRSPRESSRLGRIITCSLLQPRVHGWTRDDVRLLKIHQHIVHHRPTVQGIVV